MCGRYVITKAASKTKNIIQKNNGVADEINYNAFPGSVLPVLQRKKINWLYINFIGDWFPSGLKK